MSYREDLKAFVDGELSPARTEEMRRAISDDPALAAEADELRSLSVAFKAIPQPEPHGLDQTLRALRLAEPKAVPRRAWGWWLGLGLAGAGALVLVLGSLDDPRGMSEAASSPVAEAERTESKAMDGVSNGYVARAMPETRLFKEDTAKAAAKARVNLPNKNVAAPITPPPAKAKNVGERAAPTANAGEDKALAAQSPAPKTEVPAAVALSVPDQDEIVELRVASLQEAQTAIEAFAAENDSTLVKPQPKDASKRTLMLEVPEDKLESVLKKLKELPQAMADARNRVQFGARADSQSTTGGTTGATTGGTGGGGFGGAGGGAGGGAAAGPPATGRAGTATFQSKSLEATAKKKEKVGRRIKIILISTKPKEPTPEQPG
ncbi:MAG: anti-sigma factor [Fimbriimonas sp.]